MIPTLLFLVLAASPVDAAKAHLQKGQLDEVLFDLEGKKLSAAEQPEAVKVLVAASAKTLEAKDAAMAQHLAGMALKLDARSAAALEAAARAELAQQEFDDAEKHADAWIAVEPKSSAARLLRAELAAEAGEWQRVVDVLAAAPKDARALALEARAKRELAEKETGLSQLGDQQRRMDEAARRPSPQVAAAAPARRTEVVLYGTSWCGYCRKAREWFTERGIPFVDRDVENDPDAAQELADKARAAGVSPRGVPIIDVKGKLIRGFDPKRIEAAL